MELLIGQFLLAATSVKKVLNERTSRLRFFQLSLITTTHSQAARAEFVVKGSLLVSHTEYSSRLLD